MYGDETSSLSSTIAKCWDALTGLSPGSELSWPRCAIWRVTSWNAFRPFFVKLKLTIGWLPACWSNDCFGSLMSVPESAGLSEITHQRSGFGDLGVGFWSRTTRMPAGTSTTSALARWLASRSCSAASLLSDGWLLFSGSLEVLLKA